MKAIITVSANASQNEQTCIGPNELTRQLVSQPCVEQLIKYMLGGGNPLTVGVGIIIEVIRKNNSDYDPDVVAEPDSTPSSRDPIYLGTLLRLFAQHVPDFMNLIMNAPAQKERLDSTFGEKIEPLGFDRFKTCELMAELLHCSNMALLNEVGSEELIAARDVERQRLRKEGKLAGFQGEEIPPPGDDLTMRISQSSAPDEGRKLEVTNSSADDDGFEEVTHGGDEDTSHEFVRAEEDIPDLPDVPATSFLDRDDDDFVDEPLSSPRLNVRDVDAKDEEPGFEDPELMVAPLSPTKPLSPKKPKSIETGESSASEAENKTEGSVVKATGATAGDEPAYHPDHKAPEGPVVGDQSDTTAMATPVISEPENSGPEEARTGTSEGPSPLPEGLSPHAEDTPAPLFSDQSSAIAPGSEDGKATQRPAEEKEPKDKETDVAEQEPGEASIIVGRPAEPSTAAKETPPNPVVGDYLKMQFVEYRVVPTILSFFFKYPWNNFLHNVVYDVVQQVFNGPMDRGYNPTVVISLFEAADVTSQIINGQTASEMSQAKNKTRMGYMGHLTLIAEELVKFTERHPPELLSETILDRVMSQDWINYVEGALAETRERDNAILGGVRPEVAMSNRAGASGLSGTGLSSIGLSLGGGGGGGVGGNSQAGSSALADAGLNGSLDLSGNGGNGIGPFAISAGTLMSGFGSSSDEEEDEEQESEEDVNNEVSYPLRRMTPRYGCFGNLAGSFSEESLDCDEVWAFEDIGDFEHINWSGIWIEDGGPDTSPKTQR
jgi:SIT4-associating protein SAP185/190